MGFYEIDGPKQRRNAEGKLTFCIQPAFVLSLYRIYFSEQAKVDTKIAHSLVNFHYKSCLTQRFVRYYSKHLYYCQNAPGMVGEMVRNSTI